eukprot:COSAG04_NODE_809_length_10142_cov_3.378174_19_plen_66_part_01
MMSGLAKRRAAGGLLVPALLLLVATARAQGDGGVPCGGGHRCSANEWCYAAAGECRDCYGCAVGME